MFLRVGSSRTFEIIYAIVLPIMLAGLRVVPFNSKPGAGGTLDIADISNCTERVGVGKTLPYMKCAIWHSDIHYLKDMRSWNGFRKEFLGFEMSGQPEGIIILI